MIDNQQIVSILERIADLLEIKGENGFKIRAYRLAAVQVENLSQDLAEIAKEENGLRSIDGFGAAMAEKVTELIETGQMKYLQELKSEIPVSLLELKELPGMGPRTIEHLWKELGVTSLQQLEVVARDGQLENLPRLGSKSAQKIIAALDKHLQSGVRKRRPHEQVVPLVNRLLEKLLTLKETQRAEAAGSFRRQKPTVGDLDLLVATNEQSSVLQAFAHFPEVQQIIALGETKCSALIDDLQVDCRAVPLESFGAAWQYFTGSQAHNVRMRGRAIKMGYLLNEYGVYPTGSTLSVAGENEEEVYALLGLNWIPPELREDAGEIEAAQITKNKAKV